MGEVVKLGPRRDARELDAWRKRKREADWARWRRERAAVLADQLAAGGATEEQIRVTLESVYGPAITEGTANGK